MKIYTKTGDKGTSALWTGERFPKNSHIFECLGSIDELNAHLGLAREHFEQIKNASPSYIEQIKEIQARLIDLGAQVATPRNSEEGHEKKVQHTEFDPSHVEQLEKWIDEMDSILPPLKQFILPSGGLAASTLHIARTICRRAERNIVPIYNEQQIETQTYQYMNRLSDYLFMLARTAAMIEGKEEIPYKKAKKMQANVDETQNKE